MLAARSSSRAIFLVLAVCLIGSVSTYSQSSTFFKTSKSPSRRSSSRAWLATCEVSSMETLAGARFSEGSEWPSVGNAMPGDLNVPTARDARCTESAFSAPSRAPDVPRAFACNDSEETVLAELSGLGKAGVKIARAREEVLDILRSGNACAEWFRTKDASPAKTFQSLSFRVDKRGPQDIFESQQPESIRLWRQPYVASTTQDGGAYTAITINAYGAFYRQQGTVLKTGPEGGPVHTDGTHLLTVGSYDGDTLPAQMITLLHELGHIVDLLPEDADNLDGKSVRNTNEVLRHCRPEVEARTKQSAKR
jgi:hypothetical protein